MNVSSFVHYLKCDIYFRSKEIPKYMHIYKNKRELRDILHKYLIFRKHWRSFSLRENNTGSEPFKNRVSLLGRSGSSLVFLPLFIEDKK